MSADTKQDGAHLALGCLVVIIALPFAVAWEGYVVASLWRWFVAPTFGVSPLSIAAAAGLALLVQTVRPVPDTRDDEPAKKFVARMFVLWFLNPAWMLCVGAVLRRFL